MSIMAYILLKDSLTRQKITPQSTFQILYCILSELKWDHISIYGDIRRVSLDARYYLITILSQIQWIYFASSAELPFANETSHTPCSSGRAVHLGASNVLRQ